MLVIRNPMIFYSIVNNWKKKELGVYSMNLVIICNKDGGVSLELHSSKIQFFFLAFDGTGEVTVNIFTLHAMDSICHLQPWIHSWLKDQIASTNKYIEKGSQFDEWKQDPGVALFIYAQLVREYGWQNYKDVFRKYEKTQPNLDSDQAKMDHWITTFSQQVGQNLVPLFKFWGFPVSDSTVDDLEQLPIPQIFDEFIQKAPERYSI
jgi:hypothetical protein